MIVRTTKLGDEPGKRPWVGPYNEWDADVLAIEGRFQAALSSGCLKDGLRAVRDLHSTLRRSGVPWALPAAQVWLTCLAGPERASQRQFRRVQRAARVLVRLGRLDWACRAVGQEGRLALLQEDWPRASTLFAVAIEMGSRARPPVPPTAWAALWSRRGHAYWCLGEMAAARHAWETCLAIAHEAGLEEAEAAAHASLALCFWAKGEPAVGYVHASTALNWYRASSHKPEVAKTLYHAALMLEDFGHWRDATILLYEGRDAATDIGDRDRVADTSIELVHAYIALGRLDDAGRALGEAWTASRSVEPPFRAHPLRHAELCVAEAHIRLARHRSEDAVRLLRRARLLVGTAHRPILSHRVAGHLNLAIQAGGGRLRTIEELSAIVRAMSAQGASGAESFLAADSVEAPIVRYSAAQT
jgi:tetratricopeptide (TPR) repeat protein